MADMQDLFGSSDDEASSGQNNDSSDNENEGSDNNDNGSGEEHSDQGGDEEDDDKRSEGSGGDNDAAAGSGDERNSNSGAEDSQQHESEGEVSDKEQEEDEEENVKEGSDEEVERDSDNAAKNSDASEAEYDPEQTNEGSERSAASDNENEEEDEEQQKAGSGAESEVQEGSDQEEEMVSDKESEHSDKEQQQSEDEEERAANSEPENEDTEKNAIAEDLFGDADDISSGSDAEDKIGRSKSAKKISEDMEEGEDEEEGGEEEERETVQEKENEEDEEEERRRSDDEDRRQSDDEERRRSDDEERRRSDDEEDQDGHKSSPAPANDEEVPEEEPPPEETRIDVEIPKISTDLGKDIHFVKLPNFISVETRPFDHNTYEDEIDDDEVLDEEGRARLKLKVENTIRWRWGVDEEANPVKESNAKFIKWSDGSMSLHLGSEIFDVHKQLLQGDHNHLFIRQGTGLQGQAVFRTKLTFRPHSTDSFTHRKITMSVADRSQKTQKIRILPNVGKDPEAHRSEMIKKEEDRLKASIRRESKQRRMKERAISRGLSASYLEGDRYDDEEEDDDGAISLAAIKNKFKKGALRENRPPIYSSDSEGSDIDERRARRLEKAKTISESDADASGDDVGPKKKMARIEESDEED